MKIILMYKEWIHRIINKQQHGYLCSIYNAYTVQGYVTEHAVVHIFTNSVNINFSPNECIIFLYN